MPVVQIEMLEGRNLQQKRQMVKEVTEALVRTLNCPPEAVKIIIREMKPENLGDGGTLHLDS
ncbi:MAG: 4-oxalocrotonate tautomerase [Dethiobacter sp.]|jgi:4-oxalocrotonate tautomerase|nr:MAG: 4-oxalocrotonate tautomerase [Dethiobacter sp.]